MQNSNASNFVLVSPSAFSRQLTWPNSWDSKSVLWILLRRNDVRCVWTMASTWKRIRHRAFEVSINLSWIVRPVMSLNHQISKYTFITINYINHFRVTGLLSFGPKSETAIRQMVEALEKLPKAKYVSFYFITSYIPKWIIRYLLGQMGYEK